MLLTWNIAQFREDFQAATLNRALTEESKENLHRRPRRTQRDGAQIEGRTNSEGQVKYCRCTFFGHATPDRAGARPYRVQCRVARCDMGLPAHTSHPLSRLFACFAGAPFLRQSEVVTGTQFLIGLRVLCGLLCSALPPLRTGGRRFSGSKAGRFAYMDFADLASTPLQSPGSPTPRPLKSLAPLFAQWIHSIVNTYSRFVCLSRA